MVVTEKTLNEQKRQIKPNQTYNKTSQPKTKTEKRRVGTRELMARTIVFITLLFQT